jgi:pentapeptide MXKDX repeat protein
MIKWTSALSFTVAAALVATTAFAQSSSPSTDAPASKPEASSPSTDTSTSSGAPSASPATSPTDSTKSDTSTSGSMKSDTMKSDTMKSDTMKSDTMKSDRMTRSGGDREHVKAIQQALKDKGHDPGAIDGVMGPKTSSALRDFQKKEGLTATGQIDQETLAKLGVEASGSASPATSSGSSMPSSPGSYGGTEKK